MTSFDTGRLHALVPMAAVRDGPVTATAAPLHAGRMLIVVETELRDGERLVAKTTQTQAILQP